MTFIVDIEDIAKGGEDMEDYIKYKYTNCYKNIKKNNIIKDWIYIKKKSIVSLCTYRPLMPEQVHVQMQVARKTHDITHYMPLFTCGKNHCVSCIKKRCLDF